jgi:excisionase family DNA binding protein
MNLKEAARYLQTTEEDILQMIDEGKLTAARDNYNYKIAKSQLDELL